MLMAIGTGVVAQEAAPNVLRIVCEEVDPYNALLGDILILEQISPDELTGSEILDQGNYTETLKVPFSITFFEASIADGDYIKSKLPTLFHRTIPTLAHTLGWGTYSGILLYSNFVAKIRILIG